MDEQVAQPVSNDTSLGETSLADYRATREVAAKEAPAETAPEPVTETPAIGDDDSLETGGTPEQQIERKKKLGGFQKTIARQDAELVELRRKVAEGKPPEAAAPAVEPPAADEKPPAEKAAAPQLTYPVAKPLLENFETIEEWGEALGDWRDNKRDWVKTEGAIVAERTTAHTALIDNWKANEAAFAEEHTDYKTVLASVDGVKLSPDHQRILLKLENGAGVAVAYELAQNPDELKRIAKLDPVDAAIVIGRMATAYERADSSAAPEPEIKVSTAPRPFKPINGASSRVTPNAGDMPLDDYRKARETNRIH